MNKKGFTLIELLTVIAILGILVLLAAPKFLGYTEQAKLAQIKNDVKAHEIQLSLNLTDDFSYLEADDYDGDICRLNYYGYLENLSSKNKITGKDLVEIYLFPDIDDYNSKEDVIEMIAETVENEDKKLYNKKGVVTTLEEIEKIVDGGGLYHVLPNNVVKSRLPGAFIASQDGNVLYLDEIREIWPTCHL